MSDVSLQSSVAGNAGSLSERIVAYRAAADEAQREAEGMGARSRRTANLRGLSFAIAAIALILQLSGQSALWAGPVALLALACFAGLVVYHGKLITQEDWCWRRFRVLSNAWARVSGNTEQLRAVGDQFRVAEHPYSGDLDIFGQSSLFQLINTAHTSQGQATLARYLSQPSVSNEIRERQLACRQLAEAREFRHRLEAHTLRDPEPPGQKERAGDPALDLSSLVTWSGAAPQLLQQRSLVWLGRLLPAVTGLAYVASRFGMSNWLWALPLLGQIAVFARTAGYCSQVFQSVAVAPGAFGRLCPTLRHLESSEMQAPLLEQLRSELGQGSARASQQLERLEKIMSWFELRHNGMLYPLLNSLLLWDLHCVVALERWREASGKHLPQWLSVLGRFEALSSLGGVADEHPDFSFPEIQDAEGVFQAEALGHPLIGAASRVRNDVFLDGPGTALLVTGSNMSGKSTLLRAMGTAVVMGMAGGPVCAGSLRLSPMRVFTSMRVSDSLSLGVSHFYAELTKLRDTLEAARQGKTVFFLLDEILHGTNSEERQVGARWVLSELLAAGATGAVSTHDQELCKLTEREQEQLRNVHLRETVEGDEMKFDYRLREGPVQGGNALRLMRSLGLDVPLAAG